MVWTNLLTFLCIQWVYGLCASSNLIDFLTETVVQHTLGIILQSRKLQWGSDCGLILEMSKVQRDVVMWCQPIIATSTFSLSEVKRFQLLSKLPHCNLIYLFATTLPLELLELVLVLMLFALNKIKKTQLWVGYRADTDVSASWCSPLLIWKRLGNNLGPQFLKQQNLP